MFELTIIYKMPNGKNVVSIINYIGWRKANTMMNSEVGNIGLQNIISVTIRPVSVG